VENPDILATLTSRKRDQKVVAFAAETANGSHLLAREKMIRKGADLIYLNDVSSGEVFGSSTTQGFIIDGVSEEEIAHSTSKESLAHTLINRVLR
jgi:phosphopantothenoylcysteine decarboxylase/phosphopantothenate--cysteine ligase